MSLLTIFLLLVIACAAVWLGYVLVKFNARRSRVINSAKQASEASLEEIYSAIEELGSEPPNGYVLARTNRVAQSDHLLVPLVGSVLNPWRGQQVEIAVEKDVVFTIVKSATVADPQFLGRVYRPVAVPRHKTKAGDKARNVYEPQLYWKQSERLRAALGAVYPSDPVALLSYLLCAGRDSFEFEPIDQARIGTSPAWVQDPEYPSCPSCNARLTLIVQVPGTVLSRSAFHRGTFYLFGCSKHPEQTHSLAQFT